MKRYTSEVAEWSYVDGLGLECIYKAGKALGRGEWLDWIAARFDLFLNEDGSVRTYDLEEYSLDQISPGKVFFELYHRTGNEKYRKALDMFQRQLDTQPRTPSGGYWHKLRYPDQMWLDGLYMQGPFKARYALEFGDPQVAFEDLVNQFELIYTKTHDVKTGLLLHAWDESRKMPWADKETGLSPCVWGRALGWYCMALVDVLDYMPEGKGYDGYRGRLLDIARKLAPVVVRWQNESGLWWQVMDRGGEKDNYLETSASTMFVYFLLKMDRKGYLRQADKEIFTGAARKGYEALVRERVVEDAGTGELHLTGICRGAGLGRSADTNPYRDGTYEYYCTGEPVVQDNLQGIGPFITTVMEVECPEKIS